MNHRLVNALGFQVGWWACVSSVRLNLEAVALIFCGLLVLAHLWFHQNRLTEIQLALGAWLLGLVIDSGLQYFSIIDFRGWALGPLSPFWLWMLWVLFALTLNGSLHFFKHTPLALAAMSGAILGPVSYVAGAELGAATLAYTPFNLLLLSTAWLVAMPVMVLFAKHISLKHTKGQT